MPEDSEALKWFRKAAEQGEAQMLSLTWPQVYAKGEGVPKDGISRQ